MTPSRVVQEWVAAQVDRRSRVAVQAPELFCQNVLQDMLVQAQVRNQLFQLPVLVLELLHLPQLADAKPAVHFLSAVEGLLRYPHPADHVGNRCARLRLLQCKRNLLFCVPRFLHVPAPCPQASKGRKTLAQNGPKNRGDVTIVQPTTRL